MKFREAAELLGLDDRLDIDGAAVREAYREAGKRLHPDAGGSVDIFSRLQVALVIYASAGKRLRSWLEDQGIAGDVRGSLSADVTDQFSPVAEVIQRSQILAKECETCRTVLGMALLETRKHHSRDEISAMQQELARLLAERVNRFLEISNGPVNSSKAWQMVRDLLFLEKWQAQLREEFGRNF